MGGEGCPYPRSSIGRGLGRERRRRKKGRKQGRGKKKFKKKKKDKPANPSPFIRARAQPLGWAVGPWPALPPARASSSSSEARTPHRGTQPNPADTPKLNRLPLPRLAGGPKGRCQRGHARRGGTEGTPRQGDPAPHAGRREARLPWPALRNVLCLGGGFGRRAGGEASPPPQACWGSTSPRGAGGAWSAPGAGAGEGKKDGEVGPAGAGCVLL